MTGQGDDVARIRWSWEQYGKQGRGTNAYCEQQKIPGLLFQTINMRNIEDT